MLKLRIQLHRFKYLKTPQQTCYLLWVPSNDISFITLHAVLKYSTAGV